MTKLSPTETEVTRAEQWRLFDLAHDNLKSIGKAQYFYLSTLLIYLSIVWGWHFTALSGALPVQILGITLSVNGLWVITPGVTTALTLGLIGAVNAAGSAWRKLHDISEALNIHVVRGLVFYELDTYKNLFDYFTYLRLSPSKPVTEQSGKRFSGWYFLYPSLYLASIYTSYRAVAEVWGLHGLVSHPPVLVYAVLCIASQSACSIRPWWRAMVRFWLGKLPEDQN
jgi:hypothetical protein